ncbi:TonB-dependent siderophore receptor [Palleronia sp. LCG004]|uniref:TonB-dependent receptor n=1 Tax=Palleronia sp. LCG004 TaxID=3079304 RepID=UPI0029420981|nr:TonB-dependent siderophore receptor [Palleronia sp. LCG004]WOI58122.1 TonB-dependent siderophore receptor [Palleronia sp. LCG004]
MLSPSRQTRRALAPALLCCTAIVPGPIAAQDFVRLPDLVLEAGPIADGETIVAEDIGAGGKISGDVLEIPSTISVVTSAEIEQRGATSVEEVLNYTAGIVTDSYGADDRFDYFSIRGFDAYTYRDGLTLGANFGGIREEPFAFERVEVFKGANSAVFGISDPGGAVNYVTKTPRDERFGSVYGTVGSFDTSEIGVDFGDALNADGTLSYRFTGLVRDGKREYPASRNDEVFVMGGLSWRPTDRSELTLIVDDLDRDGVPGSGGFPLGYDFDRSSTFFGEPDYNYRGTDRTTVTLIGRHDFGNGLRLGGTARWSDAETDFGYAYISGQTDTLAERSYFGSDGHEQVAIADIHLEYDRRFGAVESTTLVGVEASRFDDRGLSFFGPAPSVPIADPAPTGAPDEVPLFADTETERDGRAIYLQQTLDWNERIVGSFGLRHDWIDVTERDGIAGTVATNDISATTGRIGLTYRATPDLSVFASYAESVIPAGTGVEPEEGEQVEIGAKWRPFGGGTLLTASAYDLSKTNITRTNPVTNLAEPIGEIRVRGVDLEAKAEIGAVELIAALSYLDPEIVENGTGGNVGNRPARVPERLGSVWATYTLGGDGPRGDMTFGLGLRYSDGYFFDDTNQVGESDSYVAVDASYGYALTESTELSINATNLLDEKHVSYGGFYADFYNPGREVRATLRHSW